MNKTAILKTLLAKGYFLKELPPPFGTTIFAQKLRNLSKHWDASADSLSTKERRNHPRPTSPVSFDMARKGHLRRLLSIPNPLNQYHLAKCISENWQAIDKALNVSKFSITKAIISSDSSRAVPIIPFSELPERRIKLYAPYQQILQTDISNFYHAIYTHSIPWALHGKGAAKKCRDKDDPSMNGNALDYLIRQCQDGQTKGIPVGPDTSRLISELILAAIDRAFEKTAGENVRGGFRYIDDMFYCFDSEADANNALTTLKDAVREFELDLNASKKGFLSQLNLMKKLGRILFGNSR